MVLNPFRRSGRRPRVAAPFEDSAATDVSLAVVEADASGFAHYDLLVDGDRQIAGYRWRWRRRPGADAPFAAGELQELVDAVAEAWPNRCGRERAGRVAFFFDVTAQSALDVDWRSLPARDTVLCWRAEDLRQADTPALMEALRRQGFGHMACGGMPEEGRARELLTHVELAGCADGVPEECCRAGARRIQPIGASVRDLAQFDYWAARRIPALVPPSIPAAPSPEKRRRLGPEALLVAQLLQMVQRNEDVREIEAALKHDAAITYRLLRYINSPAIGAGVEIESLRHAVNMLGYANLFRWLTLLLASVDGTSPRAFLTRKAIVRGRFVELLGQPLLGRREADNLFLVGMFSAMGELMGVTTSELLDQVQLSDSVRRAIVAREGQYGAFLALALACEAGSDDTQSLADALLMSAHSVNAAHIAAIAWAREVSCES